MERYRELLRRYLLPEWRAASVLFALVLTATAVQLVQPRLLARFIDTARAGAPMASLRGVAIGFLLVAIAGQAVGVAEAYLSERLALIATNRLRTDLTRHCLRLDLSFHGDHGPGELIERIDGDVASLTNFLSRFLLTLVGQMLLLVGVLASVWLIEWRLGLGLTIFAIVVLLTMYAMRNVARPAWTRTLRAQADQSEFLAETLAATEDLRSSGATEFAMRRYFEHARAVLHGHRRAMLAGNAIGGVSGFLFTLGTAAAVGVAVWLFQHDRITIGTVFLVYMYTRMLSTPIEAITRQIQDLQTAAAAIGRVSELLETSSVMVDGPGRSLADGALAVELRDVSFGYAPDEPVLHDVSIAVASGRVLGVVGRTGSGKTTITRLLLRFYDPDEGEVRLGGEDVRGLQFAQVRDRVGLVGQEVQLFHASARDNLTFFDPSISDDDIVEVLRSLGLHDWFESLSDGLDTLVEFGGTGLSAGEAQLLAFARVFLRDPAVVILDEATSRLDPATERLVERAVTRLFEGRTALVIAHRLETVLRADQIVVMADGRVVEAGPREELMADSTSRFAELLRSGLEDVPA